MYQLFSNIELVRKEWDIPEKYHKICIELKNEDDLLNALIEKVSEIMPMSHIDTSYVKSRQKCIDLDKENDDFAK